jgi:hypothetical protein
MKVAWDIAKAFLENHEETQLFLQLGPKISTSGYTIVKLPYGDNITLLYATEWHNAPLHPGRDLKYAGFYSRQHKQTYDIKTPLTGFFNFDGKYVYEGEIKAMVKAAVQRTVADHIAASADKYSGLPFDNLDSEITRDAETAFSKKKATLDFADKIAIDEWYISDSGMVDFIDNPANIHNPDSILSRYVDDQLRGKEEVLARLWFAHCTAQKLLDRLYAESKEGQ